MPASGYSDGGPDGVEVAPTGIRAWAAGRSWLVRAPVLVWMAWLLYRYWDDRRYLSIWHGINLGFHEAGHALFGWFGPFPGLLGGTILEVVIPIIAGFMLWRQRDWFGVSVATCWLGIVCFETATYAGDAMARALPLVSPFGDPTAAGHDWANILSHYNALGDFRMVAGLWERTARLLMMVGIGFGAWLLWLMARTPASAPPDDLGPEGHRFIEHLGRTAPAGVRPGGAVASGEKVEPQ